MTVEAVIQLAAVVVGGLIAITGGFASASLLENQRRRQESRNLALAFKGEITALLELIRERRYIDRFAEVIAQIERTGVPFYMPFRLRQRYDRVYEANVAKLGLLRSPLSEELPLFYTRLSSILEDLISLGDGTYAGLDLPVLIRVYKDASAGMQREVSLAVRLLETIGRLYEGGAHGAPSRLHRDSDSERFVSSPGSP